MKKNMRKEFIIISVAVFLVFTSLFLVYFLKGNIVKDYSEETKIPRLKNVESIFINIWFRSNKNLDIFAENNIRYLFVDVGHINWNGELTTTEKELKDFLDFIGDYEKENNFDFILIPYNEIILEDYYFSESFQDNVMDNYIYLNGIGFDGAHVDLEAIPFEQRNDYLSFLDDIRKVINKGSLLTVYAGTLDDDPSVWEWDSEFYEKVSQKVDLVLIQSYDFGLESKEEYQNYLSDEISKIEESNINNNLLFTIPAHKQYPETLKNALEVYHSDVEGKAKKFVGVSLFGEWTIDDSEWEIIESFL